MTIFERVGNRPALYNVLHSLRLAPPLTQTSAEERGALCQYLEGCESAVEIGTFMGVTAAEMARRLPSNGRLYCIDPYYDGDRILAIATRHLRRAGLSDRVVFLRCESPEAQSQLPPTIDFIFVDGDHSFEGLRRDWQLVRSVLRRGGLAAFHDTSLVPHAGAVSEGAIRFFDEVIRRDPDFDLVATVHSLNVIRRRGP